MESNKVIYITNTGTVIHPYKKGQSKSLENLTSMRDLGCKFKKIEVNGFKENGMFLTYHIPQFLLKNEFPDYRIEFIEKNEFDRIPDEINFELKEIVILTQPQYQVVDTIIRDKLKCKWFINCPQGFGKTIVSIYLMTKFRCSTLIMCYSTNILSQWKDKIIDKSNIEPHRILLIDSSKIITAILDNDLPNMKEYKILICTPKILFAYAQKHGYEKINEMLKIMNIGLKIYDEAHRNIGNMVKIDALTSVQFTLYLSGDFAQASSYKTKLFRDIFANTRIVKPDESTLNDLRYTKAIVVEYNSNPSDIDRLNVMNRRGTDIWKYMEYQISKGTLLKVIYWILDNITKLKEVNRRTLILTSKIEHCEYLYEQVRDRYSTYFVGKIHGDRDDEDNNFVKENCQIIVATYQSFSTGMDTENIKYVISTSASNRVEDSQSSGRARPLGENEDCMFWMCVDVGFENQVEKEKKRIAYLREVKAKEVIKLTYVED